MKKENILKLSDKELETLYKLLIDERKQIHYFMDNTICASSDIVKNYNNKLSITNTLIKKIDNLMDE